MKTLTILTTVVVGTFLATMLQPSIRAASVAERLQQYGSQARARLAPSFADKKISYPPRQLTLVGLKQERLLELYAGNSATNLQFIRSYRILAASGEAGPKLREGDRQVPEGIYGIESLNPNSRFHLSLRINYPNPFDREQARTKGRTKLGGDIMIHGDAASIGCLAIGDEAAEDLFVLAADTGLKNITVILSPVDFREGKTVTTTRPLPAWTAALYEKIRAKLKELPPKTNER
jgi:murein L,D-transpeptidase YafK